MARDEKRQDFNSVIQIFRGLVLHGIESGPMLQSSTCDRSIGSVRLNVGIAMSSILVLLLLSSNAWAQESGRTWKVFNGGTHNTQREAELEIQGRSSEWSHVRVIKHQEITENEVNVTYWMGTAPSQLQNWSYLALFGDPVSNVSATEDELIAKYIVKYNQKSVLDGCAAIATAQRAIGWEPLQTWGDGISSREMARFDISYMGKATLNPTNCTLLSARDFPNRQRTRCANLLMTWRDDEQVCKNTTLSATITSKPLLCDRCGMVGNPSDVTTGDKYEPELDMDLGWVAFSRHYHSGATNVGGGLGYGWTHSHNVRLAVEYGAAPFIGLIQADGAQLPFKRIGTNLYEDTTGRGDRLVLGGNVWTLHQQQRLLEFSAEGRLTSVRNEDGTSLVYAYNNLSQLTTVTHNTGRRLEFGYDPNASAGVSRILSVAVNGVPQMSYSYTPAGMLDAVTYADLRQRKYHYEDVRFPSNLTGITDESNTRYSTFTYDDQGRVLSSVHAGGVEGTQLVYTANGGAQVTDANNLVTDYALTSGLDSRPRKVADVTRPTSSVSRIYNDGAIDFRRRLDTYVDRNSVTTKYVYQTLTDPVTQGVVTRYTTQEAFGTLDERTSVVDRDLATNRMTLQRVGNRELRILRNARLQPTTVQVTDTATALSRTSAITYCEDMDVANSACPLVGLVKEVNGPRPEVANTFKDITRYEYRFADEATCVTSSLTCPYRKGDVWKVTNAKDQIIEVLSYDIAGRAKSVKNANGVITDFEYSPRGWLIATKIRGTDSSTETDDRITWVDYFADGSVQRVTQPDGVYVTFGYDAAHRLTSITDRDGNTITYTLNGAGERVQEDTHDAAANLRRTLSRTYNTLGQLQALHLKNPDPLITTPVTTSFQYDLEGNLNITTDALLRQTDNDYNPLGRLKRTLQNATGAVGDMDRAETSFRYDALDRLTTVTDPNNLETNYFYNAFGEQMQLVSPDTGTTDYAYDKAGNRTQQTDDNGKISDYAYDGLNRITAITYPSDSALNTSYVYDVAQPDCVAGETFLTGRLAKMTDHSGSTTYCYDRFGQLTRKTQRTQGKTFALQWQYAANGRLQSMTYPDGSVVDYLYDTQGRMVELGVTVLRQSRQKVAYDVLYHPWVGPARWRSMDDRAVVRTQNQNGQPGIVQAQDAAGTQVDGISLGYEFDEVGNLKRLRDGNQADPPARIYGYDSLNRLTEAKDAVNAVWQSYSYDKTGNRQNAGWRDIVTQEDCTGVPPGGPCTPLPPTTHWSTDGYTYYPGTHRLFTRTGRERSYDSAGNLTLDAPMGMTPIDPPPDGGGTESAAYEGTMQVMEEGGEEPPPGAVSRAYSYNAANRMSGTSLGGEHLMSYRYNGRGERVYRQGADRTVHTVFDEAGRWIGDYDQNGAVIQQAIWLGDLPVGLLAKDSGVTRLFHIEADALGTPRTVIDPTRGARGTVVWRWDLAGEVFGNDKPNEDPDGDDTAFVLDMRYPGQQYDSASGLNYNYFRDYEAATGRYVESYPIGLAGGISTYWYAEQNSLVVTDHKGLNPAIAVYRSWTWGWRIGEFLNPWAQPAIAGGLNSLVFTESYNPNDAAVQSRERKEYKSRCNEPSPLGLSGCDLLRWKLQRNKDCKRMRQDYSRKWFNDNETNHMTEISRMEQAIEKLEAQIASGCCGN